MKHARELPILAEQGLQCLPLALNFYYMRSIITPFLPLSLENQPWPLDIFIKTKLHSSRVVKWCTRFWTQVRILILNFSFMNNFFTLCVNQLQYLYFLCHQIMLWMLFSSFLHVTFLTSVCEIIYVNWFRKDDSGMICCQFTPTLYHCATEDCGQVLLFVYLYLHWIF